MYKCDFIQYFCILKPNALFIATRKVVRETMKPQHIHKHICKYVIVCKNQ